METRNEPAEGSERKQNVTLLVYHFSFALTSRNTNMEVQRCRLRKWKALETNQKLRFFFPPPGSVSCTHVVHFLTLAWNYAMQSPGFATPYALVCAHCMKICLFPWNCSSYFWLSSLSRVVFLPFFFSTASSPKKQKGRWRTGKQVCLSSGNIRRVTCTRKSLYKLCFSSNTLI
jgi:hypothetical protein